jgi:hypothetical protein
MQGHFQDVKKIIRKGKTSDSFASHFAALIPKGTELKLYNRGKKQGKTHCKGSMSEGVEGTRQATVKETCLDVCECFGSLTIYIYIYNSKL